MVRDGRIFVRFDEAGETATLAALDLDRTGIVSIPWVAVTVIATSFLGERFELRIAIDAPASLPEVVDVFVGGVPVARRSRGEFLRDLPVVSFDVAGRERFARCIDYPLDVAVRRLR